MEMKKVTIPLPTFTKDLVLQNWSASLDFFQFYRDAPKMDFLGRSTSAKLERLLTDRFSISPAFPYLSEFTALLFFLRHSELYPQTAATMQADYVNYYRAILVLNDVDSNAIFSDKLHWLRFGFPDVSEGILSVGFDVAP